MHRALSLFVLFNLAISVTAWAQEQFTPAELNAHQEVQERNLDDLANSWPPFSDKLDLTSEQQKQVMALRARYREILAPVLLAKKSEQQVMEGFDENTRSERERALLEVRLNCELLEELLTEKEREQLQKFKADLAGKRPATTPARDAGMTKAVKGGPKAASLPPAAAQGSDLGVLKQFLSQAGLVKSGAAAAAGASPESEIVMYRRRLFEEILGAMQGTQEQTERLQKEQQQYRATLEKRTENLDRNIQNISVELDGEYLRLLTALQQAKVKKLGFVPAKHELPSRITESKPAKKPAAKKPISKKTN